jgi:hypothetical protein
VELPFADSLIQALMEGRRNEGFCRCVRRFLLKLQGGPFVPRYQMPAFGLTQIFSDYKEVMPWVKDLLDRSIKQKSRTSVMLRCVYSNTEEDRNARAAAAKELYGQGLERIRRMFDETYTPPTPTIAEDAIRAQGFVAPFVSDKSGQSVVRYVSLHSSGEEVFLNADASLDDEVYAWMSQEKGKNSSKMPI